MQGNDGFRLVVRRGPQPNQTYDLNKDIVTLGRDITNDITINDPEVSRHHMRLTRGAGGFTVEDLGSTNGTFINGQRLMGARPLRNGDMIGLGETVTLAYEAAPTGARSFAPEDNVPSVTAPNPAAQRPSPQPQPQPYAGGYQPPPQQPQPQPQYNPQPNPYNAPPQPAVAPQVPGGYEYDPYEVREEEPRNTTRWVLIGCAGLSLFCCCGSIAAAVAIDMACLWDRLPIIYDILRAFGYSQVVC